MQVPVSVPSRRASLTFALADGTLRLGRCACDFLRASSIGAEYFAHLFGNLVEKAWLHDVKVLP